MSPPSGGAPTATACTSRSVAGPLSAHASGSIGGGHFSECLGLVQLAPNESDGVSVDELYQFHGQLRADGQHEQEVA